MENITPWRRVANKFGLSAAALAKEIGRDRSKVSRHLQDPEGLIAGKDQLLLIEAAQRRGVDLKPEDMIPGGVMGQPLTMQEQADLLRNILNRTRMHGGATAGETVSILTAEAVQHLDHLALRLERMAEFEDRIRKMVMGK